MKKTVIIFASIHHGSTRNLTEAIARKYDADLIDATLQHRADLSGYEYIGFASGIAFGKFYEAVEQFLEENLPQNKQVFFLYTCAKTSDRFTNSVKQAALQKRSVLLGEYGCRGYNTYGPWKLVGGMNKNHPNEDEIQKAFDFYETLLKF